jgi:hypothetical protein
LVATLGIGWLAGFVHASTKIYMATTKDDRAAIISRLHP